MHEEQRERKRTEAAPPDPNAAPPGESPDASAGGDGSKAASNELSKNIKRARYSRADHRARQHESAHEEDHAPAHVIDHTHVPKGDAALVTTRQAFDELLAHLRDAGSFAYDSE